MICPYCKEEIAEGAIKCKHCKSMLPGYQGDGPALHTDNESQAIRRIADYEKLSAVFWLVLGIIQILSVYLALAGIWNIFASVSRFKAVKQINNRSKNIPARFEGMVGLILIGVINVFAGGVIGILFVCFDFYVRDQVLRHASCFVNAPA